MELGLGYIKDSLDARDFRAEDLGVAADVPDSFDARHRIASILYQGPLPSCVGQSVCAAIRARRWHEDGGEPPELVSRFFVWWHARNQHGDAKAARGTQIRLAIKVLNALGRPAENKWPHVLNDLAKERPAYTKKPPPDVLSAAYDRRIAEYHRVTETGDARVARLKQLISDYRFPVFGTQVTEGFTRNEGSVYDIPPPQPGERIVGGHAMYLFGYDDKGAWLANSWGAQWRDGGFAHISWEYLKWHETVDIWGISLRQP